MVVARLAPWLRHVVATLALLLATFGLCAQGSIFSWSWTAATSRSSSLPRLQRPEPYVHWLAADHATVQRPSGAHRLPIGADQQDAGPSPKRSTAPGPFKALRWLLLPFLLIAGVLITAYQWFLPRGKPKWSFWKFLSQYLFFNTQKGSIPIPQGPHPSAVRHLHGGALASPGGVVLVTGATGATGQRVVRQLVAKGERVRALVRDPEKARRILKEVGDLAAAKGKPLEIIVGDIAKKKTLSPQMFWGVKAVVSCTAVTVAPKEGDTPQREKYKQGVRFYDPEVVGDTPETVEYLGIKHLFESLRPALTPSGMTIFAIEPGSTKILGQPWGSLDDIVMGGVSESQFQVVPGAGENGEAAGMFTGVVRTENNGGFVSIRTRDFEPPLDLSASDGLELRLRGDGRRYKLQVRTQAGWDVGGYTAAFDTKAGDWQTIRLPWAKFVATRRTRIVEDAPPIDTRNVISIQLLHSKFEFGGDLNPRFSDGPLALPLTLVAAYRERRVPRFIHVGSAGVTRWNRPGVDLDKEPPAVRLNDALGGIMTYKLKGEDVVRGSGLPYLIVRPCALTEEPPGMPLVVDQGDVLRGKVSRDDVAALIVAALDLPVCNVTFEVKSTVPFSEEWKGAPAAEARDWGRLLAPLQEGVTGKTIDGFYTRGSLYPLEP